MFEGFKHAQIQTSDPEVKIAGRVTETRETFSPKGGGTVEAGQPIAVVEAMKMENIIKSPGEGVVKNVKIKKGESVEKNQVLIEF